MTVNETTALLKKGTIIDSQTNLRKPPQLQQQQQQQQQQQRQEQPSQSPAQPQSQQNAIDPNDQINRLVPENIAFILLALWSGSFISAMDTTIVSTTMTSIASSLHEADKVSYIATSFLITNAAFQPIYGKASDVYGRKTVLLFAQFWFALGCLISSLSPNVTTFIISRAISGIGGGGLSALSSIIVSDVVPLRSRGMFQGYANIMYGVGQMLGGPLGGLCLSTIGWRWMFGIQVPLVICASVLVMRNVHDYIDNEDERIKTKFHKENFKKIDFPGTVLLVLVIIFVLLIFSATTKNEVVIYVTLSIIFFGFFLYVENYIATERIIPTSIFRGTLRVTALAACFGSMTVYADSFLIPLYLQIVHDLSPLQSGIFVSSGIISTSLGSLLAGYLLHSKETHTKSYINRKSSTVSILGITLLFIGSIIILSAISFTKPTLHRNLLVSWKNWSWIWVLALGYFFTGLGYGVFLVSLLVLVIGKVGQQHQASATGMNYLFRSLGSVTGTGMTLNVYSSRLTDELTKYLKKHMKDPKERKLAIKNILSDTYYLRDGLKPSLLNHVLKIFRECMSDAAMLMFLFSAIALTLGLSLRLFSVKKTHRQQIASGELI